MLNDRELINKCATRLPNTNKKNAVNITTGDVLTSPAWWPGENRVDAEMVDL